MKSFIVQCMCCGAEKSRTEQPDLTADRISHGLCEPLCAEAVAAGWGEFVKKSDIVKEEHEEA